MGFFFFIFSGAGEVLTDKLSDEVLSKIELGRSAFKSVSKKFLSGEIQIKGLLKIFQRKQEFLDFLKIGEYNYLFFPSVSHVLLCFLSLKKIILKLYILYVHHFFYFFIYNFNFPKNSQTTNSIPSKLACCVKCKNRMQ